MELTPRPVTFSSLNASDPSSTISGHMFYTDASGSTHAIRDAYVEVWSNGIGCLFQPCIDGFVGSTSTDEAGFFTLTFSWSCGIGCPSPRIWAVAFSKGSTAAPTVADVFCPFSDCLIPEGGPGLEILRTYHFAFPPISFPTVASNIDYGNQVVPFGPGNPVKAEAFTVYDTILKAWLYIRDQTAAGGSEFDVPPVGAAFPCGFMCPGNEYIDPYVTHNINLKQSDGDGTLGTQETILHEYGHFVMLNAYKVSWPVSPDVQIGTFDAGAFAACAASIAVLGLLGIPPTVVVIACAFITPPTTTIPSDCMLHGVRGATRVPLDPTCAWSEGWADFLPAAVFNDPSANGSNGNCGPLGFANLSTVPGKLDECQVAGMFWDATHPGSMKTGATFATPFSQIFSTFLSAGPGSCSFWTNPPVGQQCISTQRTFRQFYDQFRGLGFDPTGLNFGAFMNGLFDVSVSGGCLTGARIVSGDFDISGSMTIPVDDCLGHGVGRITLPPGTSITTDTVTVAYVNNGVNNALEVSGVSVPYPPGKSISIAPNPGLNGVCIIDSPSTVPTNPLPSCDTPSTASSQVLMPCDGSSRTFSGFPDAPSTRTYKCTLVTVGLVNFMKVDGLAFSLVETIFRRTTSTILNCTPSAVLAGTPASCNVMVTDTTSGTALTPAPAVIFTSSETGTFAPSANCPLAGTGASANCSLTYTPDLASLGGQTITATYNGDSSHFSSSDMTNLNVFDFTISLAPSDQTVLRGGSGSYLMTASLLPGSAGAPSTIPLTLTGTPSDATTGFPSSLGLPGSAMLSVQTGSSSLGDFPLVVMSSVTGGTRSGSASLHIYDFSLAASPSSPIIHIGESQSYPVTITLTAGSSTTGLPTLALSVTGCPPGATCTFDFNSVDPTLAGVTRTLTVQTTTGTPSGIYKLTITVLDNRVPQGGSRSTSVSLEVLPKSAVTDGDLCAFDVDPSLPGQQFRLILTQNSSSTYKLTASNPGQFYYNIFLIGTPGATATANILIPYPFITQGAVPIQVFSQAGSAAGCFSPSNDVTSQFTITGPLATPSGARGIALGNYTGTFGTMVTVTVSGSFPSSTLAYVMIHLDHGLKGTSGYTEGGALGNDAVSPSLTVADLGTYTFSISTGGVTDTQTIQNENVFKHDPGIAGLVLDSAGTPVKNTRVLIYDSNNILIATVYTDQDGFFSYIFKYTGHPTTFTVRIPAYNIVQSITLKSNGFAWTNITVSAVTKTT